MNCYDFCMKLPSYRDFLGGALKKNTQMLLNTHPNATQNSSQYSARYITTKCQIRPDAVPDTSWRILKYVLMHRQVVPNTIASTCERKRKYFRTRIQVLEYATSSTCDCDFKEIWAHIYSKNIHSTNHILQNCCKDATFSYFFSIFIEKWVTLHPN